MFRMRSTPRLFSLLMRAQRLVHQAAERETLAALGLTPVQLGLLYALEGDAPRPMADVGRLLDLSPAALSGLADRSERIGIVARLPNARDGRSSCLVATPHGRSLRERSRPLLARFNAELVEGLDAGEQAAAAKFLDALATRYGNRDTIHDTQGDDHD